MLYRGLSSIPFPLLLNSSSLHTGEISVILETDVLDGSLDFRDPQTIEIESGFVAFYVVGQLEFSLIGILAGTGDESLKRIEHFHNYF